MHLKVALSIIIKTIIVNILFITYICMYVCITDCLSVCKCKQICLHLFCILNTSCILNSRYDSIQLLFCCIRLRIHFNSIQLMLLNVVGSFGCLLFIYFISQQVLLVYTSVEMQLFLNISTT